jgi:hypothetical protein
MSTRGLRKWASPLIATVLLAGVPDAAAAEDTRALERQPCSPRYLPGGLKYPYEPEDVPLAREQSLFRITDEYFELKPPIDWRQPGTDSQTFRFALSQLTWTQILFDAYQAGDEGALAQARDILVDFARNQRLGRAGTAPWAWGTKRTGDRATLLAYLARAGTCAGILSRGEQRALLRAIAEHGSFMLKNRGATNHGVFDGFALGVIAEQAPFMKHARSWRREAKARFKQVFLSRIKPEEGFWLENSTRYHVAVMSVLRRYLSLHLRDPRRLREALPAMEEVCAWLIEPDGEEVQLGDTWLRQAPPECVEASAEQSGAKTLPRSGAAFVREGPSYLAQFAQFFNSTHKHSDDLSFELAEAGHRVITDSGDYHRDRDGWNRFMRSAEAHSGLTVDGRDFSRSGSDAYGSGMLAAGTGDGWYAIHARNPLLADAGVDHRRTLIYRPGVALIVLDRVRSGRLHTYRRHFQFDPAYEPASSGPGTGEPLELAASGHQVALEDDSSTPAIWEVASGQDDPLAGWVSPTFRNAIARPTATFRTRGRDVDHLATLSLDETRLRAELSAPLSRDGVSVALRDADGPAGGLTVDRDGGGLEIGTSP